MHACMYILMHHHLDDALKELLRGVGATDMMQGTSVCGLLEGRSDLNLSRCQIESG